MTIETMTTAEAAEVLEVHPVTLRKWRSKSEIKQGIDLIHESLDNLIYEDCEGLIWKYEHSRKITYCAASVQRLKTLIERRKNK